MRRLIEWLYAFFFGLHVRSTDQHIAYLTAQIHILGDQRKQLDDEIDSHFEQLFRAIEARDRASKQHAMNRAATAATATPQPSAPHSL